MKPTDEQAAVLDSDAHVRIVQAFAGTGKTTTLRMLAERLLGKRVLYLAFTKANQIDAEKKFGRGVKCLTTHALAMPITGRAYRAKLTANLQLKSIIDALRMPPDYLLASDIRRVLLAYLASDARNIEDIVPPRMRGDATVAGAQRVWEIMQDPHNATVGMLHDGYLKLFQLRNPALPYDHILFDEAQDSNPVTAAIVAGQPCPKTYVGDEHQQIYQFRGAKNAMRDVQGHRLKLTQSWRFGSLIADVANRVLVEKGETSRVVGRNGEGELWPVDTSKPYTTICRTNAGIFEQAVAAAVNGECIHFVGGVENYKFDRIEDSWRLKNRAVSAIRDSSIRNFGTFSEMARCAEESNDVELKGLIRLVDAYGFDIPRLTEQVKACATDAARSNLTLVTGHKCKGLEFDQVRLADDFLDIATYKDLVEEGKSTKDELECEINLVYVAATRALRRLEPNASLLAAIESSELA